MKRYSLESDGQSITLTSRIAHSGEGSVWKTDRADIVAKVYHAPTADRIAKLRIMIANPPEGAFSTSGDIDYAWPRQVLLDEARRPVGFVMPFISDALELTSVYNPAARKRRKLAVNWKFLMTACLNLANVIRKVHEKGYVLGDIKSQNIFVNRRARVTVIDTDSFQVKDLTSGQVFRCLVGSEGFTPPELIGRDLGSVAQLEVHDRFRLGVIFHLMLFGSHPFQGLWSGRGDPPAIDDLVRQGYWPYANGSFIQAGPNTIPIDVLHPDLKACFLRCFNDGHLSPERRPDAGEWVTALRVANDALQTCQVSPHHWFNRTSGTCPWCERIRTHGVDQFASAAGTRWGDQLLIDASIQEQPIQVSLAEDTAIFDKGFQNRELISISKAIGPWILSIVFTLLLLFFIREYNPVRMAPDDIGSILDHHQYIMVKDGVSSYFVWVPKFDAYQIMVPNNCGFIDFPVGYWVANRPNSGTENIDWAKESFGGFYAGKFEASHADAIAGAPSSGLNATDGSSTTLKVAPNCVPWTSVSWDEADSACKAYDPACHLMEDDEWTALAVWSMIHEVNVYGNNSDALSDVTDSAILFVDDPVDSGRDRSLTGSGNRVGWSHTVNLTTHTGTTGGVYDLNGNVWEWTATLWSEIGSNNIALKGADTGFLLPTQGYISSLSTFFRLRRFGVPGSTGDLLNAFSQNYFWSNDGLPTVPMRGGSWTGGGVWYLNLGAGRSTSNADIGFRPVLRY